MATFSIDGHELDYEVRGDGRPLLFVHGLAVDRRVMIEACDAAAEGWRRIYVDLPGHGASKANLARASADDLVDALSAFSTEIAGAPPGLVGYSYGGYLAQGMALKLELAGIFLACPTVEADFGKRAVPHGRIVAHDQGLPFSDDPREKPAFEEVATVQTRAALELFQRVIHPANIAADQTAMAATRARYAMSRPYMATLAAFDKPVSIVCGRDDHWVGFEDGMRLARAFRDVQYTVLPRCGHLMPFEAAPRFRALFIDWLARL